MIKQIEANKVEYKKRGAEESELIDLTLLKTILNKQITIKFRKIRLVMIKNNLP